MIDITCACNKAKSLPESAVGKRVLCPKCNQLMFIVSAEPIPSGGGAGDFDAELIVVGGPGMIGNRYLLGGVAEIQLGKLTDRHIVLPGTRVSRAHCKLVRLDFGPSRWRIIDTASSNGVIINGQRVADQELQNGDVITLGEYQLKFVQVHQVVAALANPPAPALADLPDLPAGLTEMEDDLSAPLAAPLAAPPMPIGPVCPSCELPVAASALICVRCGIHIANGRPVLTSQGVDLNSLYESAYQWIRWISLLIWVMPIPMPIRSQGFGTSKPYAIWSITAITILTSLLFYFAQNYGGVGPHDQPGINLMLWSPYASHEPTVDPAEIHNLAQDMTDADRQELQGKYDPQKHMSDDQLVNAMVMSQLSEEPHGEFHPYQLLTCAFLHDTGSILGFITHLVGNLLFMLVFGTRVNALIGNIATAILYPILAVAASGIDLLVEGAHATGPMLGASGAIMGLAGMYLILFPVHQVVCAVWISIWLRFRRIFACKIFQLRGFWVLLIYIGMDLYDGVKGLATGHGDSVAHFAHIGGFATGMTLALAILFSRQFNTRGGDLLSVTLGKYAWPLIGKPARWYVKPAKAKAAPKPGALRGADFAT